jgi:thiamine kinase-like enzyme
VEASVGEVYLKDNNLTLVTKRIATALVKLHACELSPPRKHAIVDELSLLSDRLSEVMTQLPEKSNELQRLRIERVLDNCHRIAETIDEKAGVPLHRDFYQDQILFSNDQTFLVDLDLVAIGHPALDVGNFLAHLTEHGIRRFDNANHWYREESEIANHYVANYPGVTFYEINAFKALSLARHIYLSWSRPNRRRTTSRIIEEAESLGNSLIPQTTLGHNQSQT